MVKFARSIEWLFEKQNRNGYKEKKTPLQRRTLNWSVHWKFHPSGGKHAGQPWLPREANGDEVIDDDYHNDGYDDDGDSDDHDNDDDDNDDDDDDDDGNDHNDDDDDDGDGGDDDDDIGDGDSGDHTGKCSGNDGDGDGDEDDEGGDVDDGNDHNDDDDDDGDGGDDDDDIGDGDSGDHTGKCSGNDGDGDEDDEGGDGDDGDFDDSGSDNGDDDHGDCKDDVNGNDAYCENKDGNWTEHLSSFHCCRQWLTRDISFLRCFMPAAECTSPTEKILIDHCQCKHLAHSSLKVEDLAYRSTSLVYDKKPLNPSAQTRGGTRHLDSGIAWIGEQIKSKPYFQFQFWNNLQIKY